MRYSLKSLIPLLLAFFSLSGAGKNSQDREIVYLSYHGNPSSSISVCWHTSVEDKDSTIYFRQVGQKEWKSANGLSHAAQPYQVLIHRCEINDLEPGCEYEFTFETKGCIHKFRTACESLEGQEFTFVVAGDAYRSYATFHQLNKQIVKADPCFVVIGGDIAYTKGVGDTLRDNVWEIKKWHSFFTEWKNVMKGPSGNMIPIVPVVGNHDVPRKMIDPKKNFVLLYQLFPFFSQTISYGALDIGSYLSLFLLDTDHTYPILGAQTRWLDEALKKRFATPFKMAVYHVGGFPSVYSFSSKTSTKVRQNFSPLFEQWGVSFAFEHHNHAYKRTYPIKNLQIDPNGVVYLGDGSWGVSPRRPYRAWYLEKRMKENCFNIITLTEQGARIDVVSNRGSVIDSVERKRATSL